MSELRGGNSIKISFPHCFIYLLTQWSNRGPVTWAFCMRKSSKTACRIIVRTTVPASPISKIYMEAFGNTVSLVLSSHSSWASTWHSLRSMRHPSYQLYAKETDKNFRKTRQGNRQAGGVVIASEQNSTKWGARYIGLLPTDHLYNVTRI